MTGDAFSVPCTECGKTQYISSHKGRGLCSNCYELHRRRQDTQWARDLAKRRLKRQADYTAARGDAIVICALADCDNEVKGRNKQFCSYACAEKRIDSRLAPLLVRNIYDLCCMMCGRSNEASTTEVDQARTTNPRCTVCGGRLLIERNDVGGVSSIGADTPLRPRTASVPKRLYG